MTAVHKMLHLIAWAWLGCALVTLWIAFLNPEHPPQGILLSLAVFGVAIVGTDIVAARGLRRPR